MSRIPRRLKNVFLTFGLIAGAIGTTMAHPGHGLIGKSNEGIEHFITDPYHLFWIFFLTAILFYTAVRFKEVWRRSMK